MTRIFALDVEPSSKRGGQELSLADELCELARRGHDVRLGFVKPGDLLERHRAAGVHPLQLADVDVRPGARLRSAAGMASAVARAAATRPDVVLMNQYHDTLFGAAVAALGRAPMVCHLRLMPPENLCTQWRLGLPRVTRFIAVSRAVADAWIGHRGLDPAIVDVAHDGVDTEHFRPRETRDATRAALGVPAEAFVVLCVGRLDPSKNVEGLLRAFAALGLPPSRARLLVAGRAVASADPSERDAYEASLRALAGSLGVGPAVHWLGSRQDVPDLLAACDVASLFAYHEAFGRATVEALACGRPVIATRGGGTDEILTGEFAAWRFDARDPEAAAALLASLADWQRRDPTLGERARVHAVRSFSVAAKASAVERTIDAAHYRRGALGPAPAKIGDELSASPTNSIRPNER